MVYAPPRTRVMTAPVRRALLSALAILISVTASARAQNVQRVDRVTPRISRAYDVSDLITGGRPDDQPDPAARPRGPDDPIDRPHSTNAELRDGLIRVIRETVDPRSWDPEPGTDIVFRDGELVITQTPANHRGIANLFRQFRDSASPAAQLYSKFTTARLPGKRFDRARLTDVLDWIAGELKVKVEIDWPAFERIGIGPDAPVTLDLTEPLAPRALRAALFAAAAGRELPVDISTTAAAITVKLAVNEKDTDVLSCGYDIHLLPTRAAGLDPNKSHPRQAVIDALVKRVDQATHPTAIKENVGLLIVTAPRATQRKVQNLLDRLDAEAMEERAAHR
jgi:hypothetical protein